MINRVVLVGRLTKDLELKYSQSGVAICRFTIEVNRTYKNGNGETEADFPNILTFRKTAENAANFLKKGSLVGIDGRIQTGSYEGQDGKRVYTTEVIADSVQFLEPRSASSDGGQASGQTNTHNQSQGAQNRQETTQNEPYDAPPEHEDDLPF